MDEQVPMNFPCTMPAVVTKLICKKGEDVHVHKSRRPTLNSNADFWCYCSWSSVCDNGGNLCNWHLICGRAECMDALTWSALSLSCGSHNISWHTSSSMNRTAVFSSASCWLQWEWEKRRERVKNMSIQVCDQEHIATLNVTHLCNCKQEALISNVKGMKPVCTERKTEALNNYMYMVP